MTESHQLSITDNFNQNQIQARKETLSTLRERGTVLLKRWRNTFGNDTPVAIDKGSHATYMAFQTIQSEREYQKWVETATERFDDAEWYLAHHDREQ